MKSSFNRSVVLSASVILISALSASAVNTLLNPLGDLVLYFQKPGDTDTVYVNLGDVSTFRGTTAGIGGSSNSLNITNINTTLVSAFGANWASDTGIYAGVAGVTNTSVTSTALNDLDPSRTIYLGARRDSLGTVGVQNSTGYNLTTGGDGSMTNGAQGIFFQNNQFEINGTAQQEIITIGLSGIDDSNPFVVPGLQGAAFNNTFGGGVQQVGAAGDIGDYFGVGTAEFAFDLFRIQARNNIAGQVTGTNRVGSFEGSIVVDTAGDVSFLVTAVPEPSTIALSGLALGGLLLRRRRNA